ncbi:MAG: copper amine oxidase N-terminal domain-containing protein, partial [Defluviitaleaceae bacterium]|nr:copper amine oxidase N-terminal domain-containing protein [Defluviitaleaceae bacterium]
MALTTYRSFEDTITRSQHVVVAEFVTSRPFGPHFTEFEFIVHERVFGNPADTIFVYHDHTEMCCVFFGDDLAFTTDTHYLLTLTEIANVYASFYDYGLVFYSNLILDLNNPSRSTLYGDPLSYHSVLNFNNNPSREAIISHIRSLPRDPFFVWEMFISSENLGDIINGSPYVLIIEINEHMSLGGNNAHPDIMSTDIYNVTVVEVLKGNMRVGDELRIVFFAGTVFPDEIHLVSVRPTDPGNPNSFFHEFTSRNSLHDLEQRDEIAAIIRGPNRRPPANNPGPWQSSDEEPPTSSPTPTPTTSPTPTPNPLRFTASLNSAGAAASINLTNIDVALPEAFATAMQQRDSLNTLFLQEEMHNITVPTASTQTIISVYIADLDLTNEQLLMLRGFTIDPATGDYTIIPGTFSADRSRFYFHFTGTGIIGALIYEMPTPLLRLNINQYRYYYRGTPQTSDAAPFITQNRTMVPIRLVSEALGATPRWDRATRTAYIYYNDTTLSLPVGQQLPGNM